MDDSDMIMTMRIKQVVTDDCTKMADYSQYYSTMCCSLEEQYGNVIDDMPFWFKLYGKTTKDFSTYS